MSGKDDKPEAKAPVVALAGEKVGMVKCKASASLLPNNLTTSGAYISYIHRSECHLVENKPAILALEKTDTTKCLYNEKDPLSQIRYLKLAMGEVLVAITLGGLVHIYEENGQKLLHFHKLQKSQVALSAHDAHLKGIAADNNANVFIGSGSGEILVFNITAKKMALTKKLEGHQHAVQDLNATDGHMVSGDEFGSVVFWSYKEDDFKKLHEIKGDGNPVTTIAIGHGYAVVGFSTGHIRIYSLDKHQLKVEITAHTRTINTIDMHPTQPMFATVSEDTFLSVWSLPTPKSSQVRKLHLQSVSSGLLTGVRFNVRDPNQLLVTCYDSRFLMYLDAPKL